MLIKAGRQSIVKVFESGKTSEREFYKTSTVIWMINQKQGEKGGLRGFEMKINSYRIIIDF